MRVRARRGGTVIYGELRYPLLMSNQVPVVGEEYLRLYGDWDIQELEPLDPELVQRTKAVTREVLSLHHGNVWDHQLAWEIHNAIVAELERPIPLPAPRWRRLFRRSI